MMRDGRSGMSNPTFILEKKKLQANLAHFEYLAQETGIKWLYTLKAFHEPEGLEMIAKHFDGFSIGNRNEYDKVKSYPNQLHSYAPAFYEEDVALLAKQSTTMSFNSLTQWKRYAKKCSEECSVGLRINPKLILQQPEYCNSNRSRLGVPFQDFLEVLDKEDFNSLEGLHFHAFCYQDSKALTFLLKHIVKYYTPLLHKLKWINFGGGLNFTDPSFNTVDFIQDIQKFSKHYPHLTLYFEPASAVLKNVGILESTVMDIIPQTVPIVILDVSIEAHLIDVAITKQQPNIKDASRHKSNYPYQLTGLSCIAGDVIGSYYFHKELFIGDKIYFEDILSYTLVKQNKFNGLKEALFSIQ